MSLRRRLLLFGIVLTAGPLIVIGGMTALVQRNMASAAREGTLTLAKDDLHHILELVAATSRVYVDERERRAEQTLVFARELMSRSGAVRIGGPAATVAAKNQFTADVREVTLPGLQLGGRTIALNSDPAQPTLVVDDVRTRVGAVATIFQRMNDGGDMLRVATNVIDAKGRRAVGTYIPATNPDGRANPVVTAVMSGQTYVGRAFVVNAWYLAAYEPIRDGSRIVGMLFIGLPERDAFEPLLDQLAQFSIGKTGYIYILTGSGESRGTYVLSRQRRRDGENVYGYTDADGRKVMQELVDQAVTLQHQQKVEHWYDWRETADAEPRRTVAAATYFAPWDWVIAASVPEDELMATTFAIERLGTRSTLLLVALSIVAVVAAVVVWSEVSRRIARQIGAVVQELRDGSHQVVRAASQVATSAQSLSSGATEQAASLEETSASMEEMASMTRHNAAHATKAAALMAETVRTVTESHRSLGEMVGAMRGISESSGEVAKIAKTIDAIAFQTNILALNAAVEAARAGDAGMGFAVVADEVRTLAQRSGQAARDTAVLIEGALERSRTGDASVRRVAQAIEAITAGAGQVKTLVDEISDATAQQSHGIDQVAAAVAQMEKVTQSTAAVAQESAAASEQLNAQAEMSRSAAFRLADLVGGAEGAHAHRRPRGAARQTHPAEVIPLPATGTDGRF